jgi:hypothetical protein
MEGLRSKDAYLYQRICAHALGIGVRPVIQRPCYLAWAGLRPVPGGVVFFKLSKLLNQEGALGAPGLRGDFCSPQRPVGCGIAADRRDPTLLMSH